jgi:molybdate transport system substrate-binding protein
MKRFALAILLVAVLLASCGPAAMTVPPTAKAEPRTLTVFAASSLTEAFTEIGKDFEAAHPGVTVAFNFAGSGALRTQLEQGAAADVFASANQAEMDTLVTDNLVMANSSQVFLNNSLVVILPAGNPANIQTLQDLGDPGIKLVLGDRTVPAGKYARQVLANLDKDPAFAPDFNTRVLANVVSNETNVRQVAAKVQLGEADAGIVYVSDAAAAPDLKTIAIPAAANVIAKYPLAVLINAPQPGLASEFIAFVLSSDGQMILKNWGFIPAAH